MTKIYKDKNTSKYIIVNNYIYIFIFFYELLYMCVIIIIL